MNAISTQPARQALRREILVWQRAAVGLLFLSTVWNGVQVHRLDRLEAARRETAARLEQAEHTRDLALEKLGSMVLQMERDKQAQTERYMAYGAVDAYTYIGECTVTAYCPCEACCGQWADGLTATGIPASAGIVAVDPEVIPLGSTVIIDGQRYLAADTGVTGNRVDICMASHEEAVVHGVRRLDVWVEAEGGNHGSFAH